MSPCGRQDQEDAAELQPGFVGVQGPAGPGAAPWSQDSLHTWHRGCVLQSIPGSNTWPGKQLLHSAPSFFLPFRACELSLDLVQGLPLTCCLGRRSRSFMSRGHGAAAVAPLRRRVTLLSLSPALPLLWMAAGPFPPSLSCLLCHMSLLNSLLWQIIGPQVIRRIQIITNRSSNRNELS